MGPEKVLELGDAAVGEGIVRNPDEKPGWLGGRTVTWVGGKAAFSGVCPYGLYWVRNEEGCRFNINRICWYKRSA